MFGFLKEKLKKGIEKIKESFSKEETIEDIDQQIESVERVEQAKREIEEKKQLLEESGFKIKPELEKAIEAPYTETLIEEEKAELKEKLKEKREEKEVIIPHIEVVDFEKEEKKKEGFLEKIKKAITEKTVKEEDLKSPLWDLQLSLIESDVAVDVAEKIVSDLKKSLIGKSIGRGKLEDEVSRSFESSLKELLSFESPDLFKLARSKSPYVILFLGFNGAGKTTTIARIGHLLKKNGLSPLFAAGDTWRAAAIEQLEEHGRRLSIPVIKQKYGADPAAVIFDAIKYSEANGYDVVLCDTAGRSHTNVNLMEEIKKVCRVNKPDMKILVLDALTGNDIFDQCKLFNDAVTVDGLVITKADVYDKGGAIISASHTLKKPILFLGMGEKYDDLVQFEASKVIENILE